MITLVDFCSLSHRQLTVLMMYAAVYDDRGAPAVWKICSSNTDNAREFEELDCRGARWAVFGLIWCLLGFVRKRSFAVLVPSGAGCLEGRTRKMRWIHSEKGTRKFRAKATV